jgi:secreted trypsin-like serine protease
MSIFFIFFSLLGTPLYASELLTPESYMMKGDSAQISEFPFYVELATNKFCGGCIIGPRTIITAAHCVEHNKNPNTYKITLCDGQVVRAASIIPNSMFRGEATADFRGDLALITLTKDVPSEFIGRVDLEGRVGANEKVTLAGKGQTERERISSKLLKISVDTVDIPSVCQRYFQIFDTGLMICCYSPAGHSPAHGDSGGPMVDQSNNIVGVMSFISTDAGNHPFVYTRLSSFKDFIQQHLSGTSLTLNNHSQDKAQQPLRNASSTKLPKSMPPRIPGFQSKSSRKRVLFLNNQKKQRNVHTQYQSRNSNPTSSSHCRVRDTLSAYENRDGIERTSENKESKEYP